MQKKIKKAKIYSLRSLPIAIVLGLIVAVIAFITIQPLYSMYDLDEETLRRALNYSYIIIISAPIMTFTFVANTSLTARGDARSNSFFSIIAFFLNINIRPYIFIRN